MGHLGNGFFDSFFFLTEQDSHFLISLWIWLYSSDFCSTLQRLWTMLILFQQAVQLLADHLALCNLSLSYLYALLGQMFGGVFQPLLTLWYSISDLCLPADLVRVWFQVLFGRVWSKAQDLTSMGQFLWSWRTQRVNALMTF